MEANKELARKLGRVIKRLRKKNKTSQEALSEALGVDKRTLIRYENGTTSMPAVTMFIILQNLNIPLPDITRELAILS